MDRRIMPTEYDAQILKLRLPEQDELNDAERCSADPAALNSIGRTVGHQAQRLAAGRAAILSTLIFTSAAVRLPRGPTANITAPWPT